MTRLNPKIWIWLLTANLWYAVILYAKLPSVAPTHWGWTGAPDSYGPKFMTCVSSCIPIVVVCVVMFIGERLEYVKSGSSPEMQEGVAVFVAALLTSMNVMTLLLALNPTWSFNFVMPISLLLGVLTSGADLAYRLRKW